VGGNWWAKFRLESRSRDRDAHDTAEALSKSLGGLRIEPNLPWETGKEEQHKSLQQQQDREQEEPARLSKWVHWTQISPRRRDSRVSVDPRHDTVREEENNKWLVVVGCNDTDIDSYCRSNEVEALRNSGLLKYPTVNPQMETEVDSETLTARFADGSRIEQGELGLAVESGGPLGQMRFASGTCVAFESLADRNIRADSVWKADDDKYKTLEDVAETPGHGQPGKRWVGGLVSLGQNVDQERDAQALLAPIFSALLAELQRPPVLPTLRRNLETLSFYFCPGSNSQINQLVLVFGYRDRGRGRAQRTNAVVSPRQNSTTMHAVSDTVSRTAAYASQSCFKLTECC
jgi:hypothetical protein